MHYMFNIYICISILNCFDILQYIYPNAFGQHRHRACTTPHQHQHHTTPHQHHTLKFTKNSQKIMLGTTQRQQKIEENHVLWHPWAIPGHSWVLLGRPRWSKGEKVTKNVVRSPPSRDLFWSTFPSKGFCSAMHAPLSRNLGSLNLDVILDTSIVDFT